ncbi:uncharacterized protein [Aegilops tauschii subsp. strangulata]|nr:uncharacterized protein LOC109746646 [Aegilops tauschii subsp. strangulata]
MIPCRRRANRPRRPGDLPRTCATRDWAGLGDGPAGLIAELALASDVADYIRFRTVCQPWRRCSPDPRASGLDVRFLPRQWIMLDKAPAAAGPRRHRFLNLSTGECIRMDLPQLAQHTLLTLTPEGLLLLLAEPTLVVRLLNPLTHQLINLPPMTALLSPEDHRAWHLGFEIGMKGCFRVSSVGLVADASTVSVAVSFYSPMVLAVAKPGDESWTVVDKNYICSTLSFGGRVYSVPCGVVMVLKMGSEGQQPPRLETVVDWSELFHFCPMAHSLHLVDNGGDLLMVHRALRFKDDEFHREYNVYRVDLEAGVLVPTKSFNGRAVFMGMSRAISVSADAAFPSLTADTIYQGRDWDGRAHEYSIVDGSKCNPTLDRSVCPSSIVDCLRYCIQGVREELV